MPVDLPLYKSDSGTTTRRPRANKRVLLGLAAAGICFVLFLNARLTSPDSTPNAIQPENEPSAYIPSSMDVPSVHDQETVEEELQEEFDVEPEEEQQPDAANAISPHSSHHNALPHPWADEAEDDVVINDSNHYPYLVVVASSADQMSRRNLIREKYFGLRDNLLPCMRYNTDVLYKFLIHGGPPKSDTPLRRQYEGEKMEWNDLEELAKGKPFEQATVIEWVETSLAQKGRTYDYLIVQDINTFTQIATIKHELDNGVISENTESPITVNADAPTNLVWGNFGGHEVDKHAFVIGSMAAKLVMEKQKEIQAFNTSQPHLLTNMYNYYNAIAQNVEHAVDQSLEPEAAAEVQEQVIPLFVREDGEEDTHRFIRWENNVESVHAEDSVVTHVLQDAEFTDLARWTYLKPVMVCHSLKSAFTAQPPLDALDDDEEASDLVDPDLANETLPESRLQTNGPSIALVTSSYIYDACMEPSATRAADNKRRFALRHNHAFIARSAEFAQQRGRKAVWGKIDAVEKVLPKYEWLFWMDMDAVVMNQDVSLTSLLDSLRDRFPGGPEAFNDVDLIVSRPTRDPTMNAGVFFLRNSPWSMQFLREVQGFTEWYNKGSGYEQSAMWQIMMREENKPHVFLLDRDDHTFNTFPRFYKPGDFVVHFAPDKCPNDATVKGLDAADRIERGEVITSLDEE